MLHIYLFVCSVVLNSTTYWRQRNVCRSRSVPSVGFRWTMFNGALHKAALLELLTNILYCLNQRDAYFICSRWALLLEWCQRCQVVSHILNLRLKNELLVITVISEKTLTSFYVRMFISITGFNYQNVLMYFCGSLKI